MIRAVRNVVRLLTIAWTMARYDALFPLAIVGVSPLLLGAARRLRRAGPAAGLRPGQRLAKALQELGPSFIKLGQTLATRSDLFGDELTADLSELQDRLPPFPGAEARAIVEAELGRPVADLFDAFEDVPVAAASIAQVHLATAATAADAPGAVPVAVPVAVKVLRPGIEAAFDRDLDLFYWLAGLIERTQPALRRLRPTEVVRTFADTVRAEMDLRLEAAAASELAENFAEDPGFVIPKVDWTRTSRRVLTLERVSGIRIDEREALVAAGHDPDEVIAKAATLFFTQVFRDGFFHADLHPGNLFVDADGRIAAVDFGIMGRLDRKTRNFVADILLGFLTADYRRVAEVHFRAGYVPPGKSLDAFTQACRSIGEPILDRPTHEISIARLLAQLFQITEAFEMETQPQLLLLQKTMLVAEGVGRRLNDRVNMWELARPLIEDWMRQNRSPEARVRDVAGDLLSGLERLPALIRDMEAAAAAVAEGGVQIHPESLRALGAGRSRDVTLWPLWVAVAALAAAVALL